MTRERWQKVEELFHAALEREPGQRAAFLYEACRSDPELLPEVESLITAYEQDPHFIDSPAIAAGILDDESSVESSSDYQDESIAGRLIGPYKIIHEIGRGGMGRVCLAHDMRLGRRVALKLLPAHVTKDHDNLRRFKREARAISALNHPNILTIHEIGDADGLHFIATEYVEGDTLRQRMLNARMNFGEALDVAIQVASALAAAHHAGIVHRDIKPENIILRPDGYAKVLDFGLAKLTEHKIPRHDTEASTLSLTDTEPGMVLGTPKYMSPEQVRGQAVDTRSDIFSLGVVLYEMVAGRMPFEGDTAGDIIAAILGQQALPLEGPAELERIVRKALARDKEERYQVIEDFVSDLKSLKLELEVEAKLRQADRPDSKERAKSEDQLLVRYPGSNAQGASSADLTDSPGVLEPVGGAVPLDSKFYIVRPADHEFHSAFVRRDSIVLVKGARQVGKTSLLARGLQQARESGARVVLTDFQSLNVVCLESIEKLLQTLAELIANQLELDVFPNEVWNPHLSPSINFERYLRREPLAKISSQIVWGLDEVDRLFTCDFGGEVFGLFRSWHNKRALDPSGPWHRLTLAIAYATEAHLFITDLNQSPFNVGTRLLLEDFTFEQVEELNRRHGSPLRNKTESARYYRLVGGHPYLVRRGLHEMVTHSMDLRRLEALADHDEGPFGDHLRRILVSLVQDSALCEAVRGALAGRASLTAETFYRLRSAGLMSGDSARDMRPRCQLYARYLERHLL